MRRQFRWDKKYLYWGITAFLVIAGAILFLSMASDLNIFYSPICVGFSSELP